MKKLTFFALALLLLGSQLKAQTPQFVLVHNDTSSVFTTWDATYAQAVDGDNIYLPGTTINQMSIGKKLHIYGAGFQPTYSSTTGITICNYIWFNGGASEGSIEGIYCTGDFSLSGGVGNQLSSFLIKRCRFESVNFGGPTDPINTRPTNITITECIFSGITANAASNNIFTKNIIKYYMSNAANCEFRNNVFLYVNSGYNWQQSTGCSYYNNIFLDPFPFYSNYANTNSFYNNLKVGYSTFHCTPIQCTEINNITVPTSNDIFQTFDITLNGFPFLDDYHLKATCIGKNAGTDGTDVGIYCTSSPTPAGWVPSNPIFISNK